MVVSRRDGDYLADAKAKLLALADFAEEHGECFVRIESVAAGDDGSLRVLDLLDPRVREGIRGLAGGKLSALYDAPFSRTYQ